MSEPASMHSSFYRRTFLLVTALTLGYALYRVLEPLLSALAWAVVLAFILHPLHEWLGARLRGRTTLSAGLITTLTPFLVLAPLAALGVAFAEQVARLIIFLRGHPLLSYEDLLNRLSRAPVIGPEVTWARDSIPVSVDQVQSWLTGSIETLLKSAASVGGGLALGAFGTLMSFFLMLVMLFFFLKDGRAMLESLARLIPVERAPRTRLLKYLGDVTRAVVFGSAATAVIQGVVIGIGFAIVGVPSPLVFGTLAIFTAFLPAGGALVVVPAILYLAATGHWGGAVFLSCLFAALSVAENILRPMLTAQHASVSTLALFIGAIGGAVAFGILGLVLGPVLLSFVVALVRFAQENLPADA